MTGAGLLDAAIHRDELGIGIGLHGAFRLKTVCQPVYRRQGGRLLPCGVEAMARVFREGEAAPAASFFAGLPDADRFFVESLCRMLHLENRRHLGVDGLKLFLNFDPRAAGDPEAAVLHLGAIAQKLGALGLDPALLVLEVTAAGELDRDALARLAGEMRRLGMRLAIGDFSAGSADLGRIELARPDIVRFDGAWFRRVSAIPRALRLASPLVAGFQKRGAEVLIEGIETAFQLDAALEAGADLVQGFLLGRPALAGTIFDPAPLGLDALLRPDPKVINLIR